MSYQLDSDTSVEILRGTHDVGLRLRMVRQFETVFVSAITATELLHGAARRATSQRERLQVQQYLAGLRILTVDYQVAERFAMLKAGLQTTGNVVADFDLLVAATALVHGHTLVTHNTRHFARFPGLLLDDWLV